MRLFAFNLTRCLAESVSSLSVYNTFREGKRGWDSEGLAGSARFLVRFRKSTFTLTSSDRIRAHPSYTKVIVFSMVRLLYRSYHPLDSFFPTSS